VLTAMARSDGITQVRQTVDWVLVLPIELTLSILGTWTASPHRHPRSAWCSAVSGSVGE